MLALMWKISKLKRPLQVALAVALSPWWPACSNSSGYCSKIHDALYLRQCNAVRPGKLSETGVCLFRSCRESYLSLSADEVGRRLPSHGVIQFKRYQGYGSADGAMS